MLGVWDDEVLRGSIPDTWDSISGMYRKMNDELADEARNAASLGGDIKFPEMDDPTLGLGKIADELGAALNMMTLSDFVLDPSVAKEIDNCFIITNQCINTKWKSLGDLVESGVEAVQFGVGGQIMDLDAVNDLVTQAQKMGGVAGELADQVAADIAQMVREMADVNLPLTIDPTVLSNQILELQRITKTQVIEVKKDIIAATDQVNAIVSSWNKIGTFEGMDEGFFYQFGGVGAAFGEATGRASDSFNKIKGRRFKRREQVRGGGGGGGVMQYDDPIINIEKDDGKITIANIPGAAAVAYDIHVDEGGEVSVHEWDTGSGMTAEQDAFVAAFQSRNDPVVSTEQAIVAEQAAASYSDWGYGEQFGGAGGRGGRRGVQNTSHSVMNISINTKSSVQDILSDLKRIQYMDDASFFNSVS
jgi:hypothetical protein